MLDPPPLSKRQQDRESPPCQAEARCGWFGKHVLGCVPPRSRWQCKSFPSRFASETNILKQPLLVGIKRKKLYIGKLAPSASRPSKQLAKPSFCLHPPKKNFPRENPCKPPFQTNLDLQRPERCKSPFLGSQKRRSDLYYVSASPFLNVVVHFLKSDVSRTPTGGMLTGAVTCTSTGVLSDWLHSTHTSSKDGVLAE